MAFWKSSLNPFICSGWTDHIHHTFPASFIAVYCLSRPTRCNSEIILALLAVCRWIPVSQFGFSLLKEGCEGGRIVGRSFKETIRLCEWRDTNGSHVYRSETFKTISSPSLWGHLTNNGTGAETLSHWFPGDWWAVIYVDRIGTVPVPLSAADSQKWRGWEIYWPASHYMYLAINYVQKFGKNFLPTKTVFIWSKIQ